MLPVSASREHIRQAAQPILAVRLSTPTSNCAPRSGDAFAARARGRYETKHAAAKSASCAGVARGIRTKRKPTVRVTGVNSQALESS